MLSNFTRYLRYSIRTLMGEPGYAVAFVLTLGLGIGANTAIFSLVNGVLLRPLPYPEADRIVYLQQPAVQRAIANTNFSFTEIADYREQASTLEQVVEYGDWTFNVLDRGDPHRAVAGLVTANFFEVLGMRPLLGRALIPEDRVRGAAPVAVLTFEYWTSTFGGDPSVVGQVLNLTTKQATIVGVLEPGSHYATQRDLDFYANYASNDHYSGASMQDERSHRMTDVFARMTPEATLEQTRAELEQIAARLHAEYPENYPADWGMNIEITPWLEELTERARPTLLILLGTAAFVLVIACANVANLTLTRLIRRERELAVRAALGAGRSGIRSLVFAESLVLAVTGAVLGLVVAYGGLGMLTSYTSRFTPRTGEITIDTTVLAFTVLVAAGAAVAFAFTPGMTRHGNLAAALTGGGGHATSSKRRRQAQRALVVGQVALSFMLLVGAGLLLRTLVNLYRVDPGFDLGNVLSMEAPKFGPSTREEDLAFSDRLVESVRTHPGVEDVALTGNAPLGGAHHMSMRFQVDGRPLDPDAAFLPVSIDAVSAGFFKTVGTPVVRGREFTPRDTAEAPLVAVISESMARHFFRDGDPVGERLAYSFGGTFSDYFEVVGVVSDTRATGLQDRDSRAFYVSDRQRFGTQTVLVRTAGDPTPVAPHVVEAIRNLDPERPVEHIQTLAELRAESIAPQRLNATLFGAFAGLALAIAAVGIAGVLAFSVSQRTREIGIRVALGANRGRVLKMVLLEGGGMAVLGLLLGAAGAVFLSRLLTGLLFGVQPLDWVTYGVVGLLLLSVSILASALPARRATGVDPMVALRSE